ncbi:MAG TPA: membrane protein insertase YidC, partial [Pusillimonas sp.]|uniref:membrane protein insertase YidC n=1 Tax=Pusillimonas sp. TaxID=3040095 RepID=UPI002C023E3D
MDIRRTILWMIFSFSLLLLWNNWQVYNGKPSLFSGASQSAEQTTAADTGSTAAPDNVPAGIPAAPSGTETAPRAPVQQETAAATSEKVSVTTDVYNLQFDTQGAQLVRAELLKFGAEEDANQPMVLLNNQPGSTYLAQTGIVGAPQGQSFPTHLTPFRLVSTETALSGDRLDVVFEAESGGVRVVKTYTLNRGRYDIQVRHDVYNQGQTAVSPSVYLQLTRDGNDPPNTSFFYNTFTGPAVYSSQEKYQKVSFSDIDKNKASYVKQADDGWVAMVQHYFASAWVPVEDRIRHNEVLRVSDNLYSVRTIQSIGTIEPGQNQAIDSRLWLGPQDQQAMQAVAPGLDVVVDYGFLTIIAKPLFKLMTWLHGFVGNWGWTIVLLTLLIKLVFYPLSAA